MNGISVSGRHFVDDKGRQRIFNGMNFVYKGVEVSDDGILHYKTELTPELMPALAARGINIIRLGVTWAGIEPEMTHYNEVYLSEVKDTIKMCAKHGIYVFVDFHQDLYSNFCSAPGDGAPKWACESFKKQHKPLFTWAEGYFFVRNVQKSFDNFWNNAEVRNRGLQDRFCDMLTHTVKYLSDCENIMGWDVLNEPFPGTDGGKIFRTLVANGVSTLLMSKRVDRKKLVKDALSGDVMEMLSVADDSTVYSGIVMPAAERLNRFDREKYYPFLKSACEAIRKATPDGVIFMENSYYSNLGIPFECPKVVYDNGETEKNLAFAPHGYDITVDSPLTNEASPYRIDFIFNEHERKQKRTGLPVLVGEWGGMVQGSEKYPALEHLIKKFDSNAWSQTYWHYQTGIENSKIMDILSRPLPVAVAGEIKRYGFEENTNAFVLSYTGSSVIKAPTLIYLPKAPVKIYSTKKYTLKDEGGYYTLMVNAGKGECVVRAEF